MKKRRNILSRFASVKGLQTIAPGIFSNRRWVKAGLILCVLLFLALALSGPQYGYNWQEVERKGIDIIIALDCSKSMLAADIKPTRLDRAKREVYDLLTMLQGDRIGLVAFAGTAFLQCPLTMDYEAFNIFLNTLTPDFLPVGGTDITGAVSESVSGFDKKSNSEKAVILITDGENTGEGDPEEAARDAEKAGVKIFCIGVGSEDGVPVPNSEGGLKKDKSGQIVLTKLDEDTLKKMSVLTGGTYVRSVAGDMDLDAVYTNEIRGKMENATLRSGRRQIWEDRYQWLLALAIIALTAELFLPSTRKTVSA
ncbi:MAG: VWA domain-containing protein [Desulfobacteraceae bacterium]|nr:VWA domain-containing protein [Desulfobacteraceae bacterium]